MTLVFFWKYIVCWGKTFIAGLLIYLTDPVLPGLSYKHLRHWFINSVSLKSQTVRARELEFWEKVHLSQHVTCHMSCVKCHQKIALPYTNYNVVTHTKIFQYTNLQMKWSFGQHAINHIFIICIKTFPLMKFLWRTFRSQLKDGKTGKKSLQIPQGKKMQLVILNLF